MPQVGVPNRQKAVKKTSSGLLVKFTIREIRILFECCFFRIFFCFLRHKEDSNLSHRSSVNDKPYIQSNHTQGTVSYLPGSRSYFLASTLSVLNF